ncbi:SLC25A36 [Bugula neritina]|uniref:SLC25A36 n=1 Tax=Bugula neritina TaxID=10212 RepID=A0A7J7KIL6_BUGNE|nr:SLC25A36 [Bugula neritina]
MAAKEEVNPAIHLVAGGVGGTVGAIVTSPWMWLRHASSQAAPVGTLRRPINPNRKVFFATRLNVSNYSTGPLASQSTPFHRLSLLQCLRHIYRTEGVAGWYKGLGSNLIGVTPSRAIYFAAYATSKDVYSRSVHLSSNSSLVHSSQPALRASSAPR